MCISAVDSLPGISCCFLFNFFFPQNKRWEKNIFACLPQPSEAFFCPPFPAPLLCPQGKIVAQGRLLLQDTFMVSDQDGGLLSRMKERRVFLFEQIVIFSEPLDKKKGFSTPGYLFKNSIKVSSAH